MMVAEEQKQLTVIGKPGYNKDGGAVKVTFCPPGPIPKPRNFGWFDEDDLDFFFLFGEGNKKLVYPEED